MNQDPVCIAVNFQSVSKTYSRELGVTSDPALKDISFSLGRGKTLGLIGANGAGKSTSIRLLLDFIRPDSGKIAINGIDVSDNSLRQKIGYLPEIASFPGNLSILDMVRFAGRVHEMSKSQYLERVNFLLEELGLWDARKKAFRHYSKGMQQRAGFVLALLHDPEILILDEPMSGLDPIGRSQIGNFVMTLKKQGKTILFCSHILEDVDRMADDLLILHRGEKRFDGSLPELMEKYGVNNIVDGFLAAITGDAQ